MSTQSKPAVSVVITCYNQASPLRFLLTSLKRQTLPHGEFEVLVADDGSSDQSVDVCLEDWGFKLKFVTQPDDGYRKSKILNKALAQVDADYLVFLDADVILEKHFLEDHLALRKPDHFICGRRVDLGPKFTESLKLEDVEKGCFDRLRFSLIASAMQKDSVNIKRGWRVSFSWLRDLLGYHKPIDLLGSNFSIWKIDLLGVNGFNEALEHYWGEDGDLFIRLRNSGKKSIGAKGFCVQFHIFHTRRTPTASHIEQYQKLLNETDYKWAINGYAREGIASTKQDSGVTRDKT